jgi:hypothetical protein
MAPPLVMAQESQRPCQATTTAKTIPKILPAMASRASSKALALMSMDALMNRFTARAQFLPSGTIANLDRFECEASHMAERLSQRSH